MSGPFADQAARPLHRYKNEFRWRVMPPEKAEAEGYFSRGFGNKAQALAYQKLIKSLYPAEPCALGDTGRYYDAHGHVYAMRE